MRNKYSTQIVMEETQLKYLTKLLYIKHYYIVNHG
jgi:hypothetical protein